MQTLTVSPLVSRPATLEDCEKIAILLAAMYQEVGRAALNPQKAWAEIIDTVQNGACYVVEHQDLLVACIGMTYRPGGLFYSDAPWFIDKFFYVRPEYRPESLDASAFTKLLGEVQNLVDSTGCPAS